MKKKSIWLLSALALVSTCFLLTTQTKAQKKPVAGWDALVKGVSAIERVDAKWQVTVTQLPKTRSRFDLKKYEAERNEINRKDSSYLDPDKVTRYEVNAQKAGLLGYTEKSEFRLIAKEVETTIITNTGAKIFPGYEPSTLPVPNYTEFYNGTYYIFTSRFSADMKPLEYELNKDSFQALAASGLNGLFGQSFLRLVPLNSVFEVEDYTEQSKSLDQLVLLKRTDKYQEQLTFNTKFNRLSRLEILDPSGKIVSKYTAEKFVSGKGFWYPTELTKEESFIDGIPQLTAKYKMVDASFNEDVKVTPLDMLSKGLTLNDKRFGQGINQNVLYRFNGRILSDEEVASRLPEEALIQGAGQLPQAEGGQFGEIGLAKPTVKIGDKAPDFTAFDTNEKSWKLSDLRGKKNLLLTFFPKCFTGGCANHLSSIRDFQTEFDATGTQILAVSVDAAEGEKGQKAFVAQWKLAFSLVPDEKRTLSKLFGAAQNDKQLAARMSILIDKAGLVRVIDTDVHVQTHGADMLAKIRELDLNR